MRRVIAAVFGAVLLAGLVSAVAADEPSDRDRGAIRDVITRQIDAFRQDDAATAFSFAAPNIRAMFGDPQRFIEMVRRSYQPVYRPRSVTFGAVTTMHDEVVQQVDLVGPDGAQALALYTMQRQSDGSWLISGCVLSDRPGESA